MLMYIYIQWFIYVVVFACIGYNRLYVHLICLISLDSSLQFVVNSYVNVIFRLRVCP